MQTWLVLFLAGLLEVVWAVGLKQSEGFTKLVPSVLTVGAMIGSLAALGYVVKELPIGTAYAVWVGIGVIGTAIAGTILFDEPFAWSRSLFLVLVVVGLVGLEVTAPA